MGLVGAPGQLKLLLPTMCGTESVGPTYGAYTVFTLDTIFLDHNLCSSVLCWNRRLYFLLLVHTQEGLLRCLETRAHKNSRIHVTIFNTGSKFQPVSNFM